MGATEVETDLLKNDFEFNDLEKLIRKYNAWVKSGSK
jgi:hypothetical protein